VSTCQLTVLKYCLHTQPKTVAECNVSSDDVMHLRKSALQADVGHNS